MNPMNLTGWETILEAVIKSGFQISLQLGLLELHKKQDYGLCLQMLLHHISWIVCHERADPAQSVTRRQYIQELKKELPKAFEVLQKSNLAPVDLAQAAIGSGMGIFSKYHHILEQDGTHIKFEQHCH